MTVGMEAISETALEIMLNFGLAILAGALNHC